jgi:phosphatidylserine/phosphatidylglycerophosphate/cardiolipin synthase-like enzyme
MKKIASWCALALAVLVYVATPALTGNASTSRVPAPLSGIQAEVLGVYFTPPTGAANAIVQTIDASQREVLVQAYGFTHNAIAQALIRAHQRGVKIRVLLDKKSEKTNRYVIDLLTQAQIDLRYDGKHAIAHNKVMVLDESVVITGSFNFTNSAETRNAENVLVLKSDELAKRYKSEFQTHWAHGVD